MYREDLQRQREREKRPSVRFSLSVSISLTHSHKQTRQTHGVQYRDARDPRLAQGARMRARESRRLRRSDKVVEGVREWGVGRKESARHRWRLAGWHRIGSIRPFRVSSLLEFVVRGRDRGRLHELVRSSRIQILKLNSGIIITRQVTAFASLSRLIFSIDRTVRRTDGGWLTDIEVRVN